MALYHHVTPAAAAATATAAVAATVALLSHYPLPTRLACLSDVGGCSPSHSFPELDPRWGYTAVASPVSSGGTVEVLTIDHYNLKRALLGYDAVFVDAQPPVRLVWAAATSVPCGLCAPLLGSTGDSSRLMYRRHGHLTTN